MHQIQSVTLHDIEIPLVHPFETSFGRTTVRTALLIQVEGNGLTGWGELTAHEAPTFSYETIETARHILEDFLIPKLLTLDFEQKPLEPPWGAPLRLRIPTKLGFKNPKYITSMAVTNDYPGGYWEDQGYNWFSGL